ncbi:DinB family protein [Hyunsoonleella aestuarii]|uniref:DinB family protein n=1 Tax=Hyunsoonleella aestuarii TaxID=912802 RepID=A0ABP8EAH7_9FLAO|nr:DinB family protein [Hyunsoonleella aestuarii]
MTVQSIIAQLESNRSIFKNLLETKIEEELLWRPKPEKWCLLEIVAHLLDEEVEDFRSRTQHVLETPSEEMSPIDPEGWVLQRDYISKNYNKSLNSFLSERDKSITWLKGLQQAKWANTFKHSKFGDMSAKLFLTNWLAHDYLHIRQILRYQYLYLQEKSQIDLKYAGKW